jgi:glycosyltransferase involved in cell wall biosynthesis
MKILYISDNIYHHMIPLANALVSEVGSDNFKYAILKPTEEFRVRMGFSTKDDIQSWAIRVYENNENLIEFEKWFDDADVVLFSNRDLFKMANQRIIKNKLTFYFSERWWKPDIGRWRLLHPTFIKLALEIRKLSKNSNFHYLAQGGYAANDIQFISKFENRIWEFGYFTDTSSCNKTHNNSGVINILWCGRMLNWKRVDTLIKAYGQVIKKHSNCHLRIIGDGEERNKLEIMAKDILPANSYSFYHSQSTDEIRQQMNSSDIFVLPSSGYEGWGAVVNEAMSES